MKQLLLAILLLSAANSKAQNTDYVGNKGQLYFSWGYNKEWYTLSNIHVRQESLGNDYTFRNVIGKDKPGWDTKSIFKQAISIPQYNYRLGYWFKDNWAFEINFDHTKYQVEQQQLLHIEGQINSLPVDTHIINRGNLMWQLNNGANFFLFNIVHRYQVPRMQYKNFNISLLMKGGMGFMTPHVENTILGNSNKPGFQLSGLNVGVEAALRFTVFKYAYLEFCNKAVYARYNNLKIYEGTARQAFGCYEMIANIGASIPLKKTKKKNAEPTTGNEIIPYHDAEKMAD
ncbi:MAG: hypothetical protein IT256_01060 [Chitinophagaceae bacterium]|nr:hypothetical protein [Chitinophagaceae bacterium]